MSDQFKMFEPATCEDSASVISSPASASGVTSRLAGWPDEREVWTGSCPCPSFSAAGKGFGFGDPRHLWPHWMGLIRECRPPVVFGEQVDAAIGHGWLDLVQTDLEAEDYAVGKAVFGACSVGAPHRRQRLYFVGHDTTSGRCSEWASEALRGEEPRTTTERRVDAGNRSFPDSPGHGSTAADATEPGGYQPHHGLSERDRDSGDDSDTAQRGLAMCGSAPGDSGHVALAGEPSHCDNPERTRLEGHIGNERDGHRPGWLDPEQARSVAASGATRGFWADCDWWYGRDGKYRPIEPGIQPLAHGATARVLKLRGYGDAIVAQAAAAFIEAIMECLRGSS